MGSVRSSVSRSHHACRGVAGSNASAAPPSSPCWSRSARSQRRTAVKPAEPVPLQMASNPTRESGTLRWSAGRSEQRDRVMRICTASFNVEGRLSLTGRIVMTTNSSDGDHGKPEDSRIAFIE